MKQIVQEDNKSLLDVMRLVRFKNDIVYLGFKDGQLRNILDVMNKYKLSEETDFDNECDCYGR